MLTRLRARVSMQAIVLGAMAAAMVAPSAFASYRCLMMGTTMSAPCCDEQEDPSTTARLEAERCCARVAVAVERAPVETTPRRDGPLPPAEIAGPASLTVADLPQATRSPLWTRAQFDAGPRIILRLCSLRI